MDKIDFTATMNFQFNCGEFTYRFVRVPAELAAYVNQWLHGELKGDEMIAALTAATAPESFINGVAEAVQTCMGTGV